MKKSVLCFVFMAGGVFFAASSARAVTVKNISDQPIAVERYGETVTIPPQGYEFVSDAAANEPGFRQMIRSKQLMIVRDPAKQIQPKLTEAYCRSDDYPDDALYCWMDLAEQDGAPQYCEAFDSWGGMKECLYYVDRKRKVTVADCNWFDPKNPNRQNCIDYVNSGIPSKPGRSYEESLKLSN
ncbi:MAG TPA: hypothetical protein VL688_06790 [Verrucomicrobiae bacterium]|jgi:hypothetical protein|nr:hypothetical protein [Verrucomicrobiae bacterium]